MTNSYWQHTHTETRGGINLRGTFRNQGGHPVAGRTAGATAAREPGVKVGTVNNGQDRGANISNRPGAPCRDYLHHDATCGPVQHATQGHALVWNNESIITGTVHSGRTMQDDAQRGRQGESGSQSIQLYLLVPPHNLPVQPTPNSEVKNETIWT